jgi:hypothetical protein
LQAIVDIQEGGQQRESIFTKIKALKQFNHDYVKIKWCQPKSIANDEDIKNCRCIRQLKGYSRYTRRRAVERVFSPR